jgi:hypothetical protein
LAASAYVPSGHLSTHVLILRNLDTGHEIQLVAVPLHSEQEEEQGEQVPDKLKKPGLHETH